MAKSNFPKHEMTKMMERARRGVAPREHDALMEHSLILAFQGGSKEAGWELFKLYQDVFSVIISRPSQPPFNSESMRTLPSGDPTYSDYEDIYQEIAVQFFLMLHEFDTEDPTPFEHKARRTLHQRFFNRFYSEFLERRVTDSELNDLNGPAYELELNMEEGAKPSEHLELYNAMNQLSPRQRSVVELSVINGWSSTEISEELGMSASTVRVHLANGLKRLKTIMGADEDGEQAV